MHGMTNKADYVIKHTMFLTAHESGIRSNAHDTHKIAHAIVAAT